MATSNRYNGNGLTYGNYYFIQWQLAGQEVGNNRSLINWQAYAHFQSSDNQLDNGRADNQYGNLWYNGGRVKNFEGNYSTRDVLLASGSFWVNHDTAGNGYVSLSGGIDYYGSGRSNASGSDSLPWIPRHAVMNSAPNFNDTDNPVFNYSNPAGTAVDFYLETPSLGGSGFANRTLGTGGGGNYTLTLTTTERNTLLSRMASVKSTTVRFVVHDSLGGSDSWSWVDRTCTIVGGEPTFVDYDYRDKNSTTSTITGNDQVLIQNKSVLELTVLSADKATANKQATMSKYNASISSINQDITYSTSNIVQELGVVGANSNTDLVVKAIDSRTNFTPVTKTISVLPYTSPQVTATCNRVNNFETSTNFHIEGVISRLTLGGTDKNAVNASTGVAYRVKKTTDGTWGSWVNKASTTSAGAVSVTNFAVDLDRNYSWNVEVRITDKLETSTLALIVPVGTPIFRIGLDGKIYNNEVQVMPSIDEDDFASNSDQLVPTQQSVKAYVELTKTKANNVSSQTTGSITGGYVMTNLPTPLTLSANVVSGKKYLVIATWTYLNNPTVTETDVSIWDNTSNAQVERTAQTTLASQPSFGGICRAIFTAPATRTETFSFRIGVGATSSNINVQNPVLSIEPLQ